MPIGLGSGVGSPRLSRALEKVSASEVAGTLRVSGERGEGTVKCVGRLGPLGGLALLFYKTRRVGDKYTNRKQYKLTSECEPLAFDRLH